MADQYYSAFGSLFFLLHQGKLLWLLNAPIIGRWFRYVLRISGESSSVGRRRIFRILPHAIFWWDGPNQRAEFRTHAKFSKRLYYAFAPLWWMLHAWDWCVADRWVPQLSFGFDTLIKYPDPSGGSPATCDGRAKQWYAAENTAWATIIAGAGQSATRNADDAYIGILGGTTSAGWKQLIRGFFLFDTSAIGADATISATVLSLYGTSKGDGLSSGANIDIYTSAPASNTVIATGDFDSAGAVSQTGNPISYANFSAAGYNNFTFNATGRGNVSKTGISKFATRNANYDVAATAPPWASAGDTWIAGYYADQAGTTTDPKLVVTYTLEEITPPVGSGLFTGIAPRNDRGIFVPTEVDIA